MDVFGGAPRFLAYPRPVVVKSGTDAVLKCQIGGDPRPAVIWERNNEKIDPTGRYRVFEDGNVYNLIISAVNTEDSGQYICKAKNSIGETYAAATLRVEGEAQEMELREENKPRFLIKPLSTRAGRGEDAVFSCKLWGNPRPEVVWEKDGRKLNEIFESTHFSVGYQDGGWFQLKIFKTRAPDGGVYTCKARNECGEALAGAVLLVDAGPGHEDEGNRNGYTNGHWKAHQGKQRIGRLVPNRLRDDMTKSTKVKMFAVTEGKHAKFRCFVTGKPKPEIIWRKDGRLILSGRRYLLYEDREGYFTLKVLYCKQKDNGVYVCAASNTAGQTISAVHLSVKEPPVRFKTPLIDLEVWERDLAVLECEVPEDSVPITWYLEDRRLQPGAKYGMEEWGTKRRLTIRDMGVDDDGIYLCEMPDGGRSIAEVAVKGTILRKLPRKVDVLEGENAAFCAEVEKEEMDIHWYKDGTELRETHQTILKSFGRTHILVFVNTMPQDSGLVTFLVGRSKTSSQLRVKAARHCPPSCPVGVQINTERANAALLSWLPAQDTRKNPPSGYVLERQEVGTGSQEWLQCLTTDTATSVEILGDSVPCEADYRFRICSLNKYGMSNNVEFPRAVHLVPVARIQAPLQDALVPEGQDALFIIELSASVIGTWFLNGTQLQEDDCYSMRRSRTHQSLRIRGVRDTDNGAEITFIAYGIRDSAALYIQAPLVKFSPLSEMDRNKFVEIGNPIVLYCELSDPAAPVHWYKNGVELQTMDGLHIQSEGTMRRIVIQSAEFSHSGVYCCDAIDDVIRFNVEVEAPPVRFSAIPDAVRNITVYTGYPIVFGCELSDPSAQVQWYKDGSKLLPQTGVDILTEGLERKLILHSAEFFHSGFYCCKTRGDTITFSVDVKAPLVKFSAIPEAMRTKLIEAGCPIVLQCAVSDPEAHVCWYKDEIELISSSDLKIHSEGKRRTLVVQSAELSHSGVYRCTTQDDTMEFQVAIKAITVTYSTITDIGTTKSLEAGKPLELECEVADSTVPVSWYKDGVKVFPQNGWDIQSNGTLRRLVIPSSQLLHSGLYSCETSDDTIHFSVDIKAPTLPMSPSPEVMVSLQAPCSPEPLCETSDPAFQVSRHMDQQYDSNKESDFETEDIKETLVIEPTHPSNSGTYYCATAEDVAQLIEKHPEPSPTYQLCPDVEEIKPTEVPNPIVQQFELSDPIAKACWYKDGTQIYPKWEADCESQRSNQAVPFQSHDLPGNGGFGYEISDDAQPNVDMKAEQRHYGDEIDEIADASAQYTVDVQATSPRLSSDKERKTSTEEPHPVDYMSSKCKSGNSCDKRGENQMYEDHSRHIPNSQSTHEHTNDGIMDKQPNGLHDNQQTINAYSPGCSIKPTIIQSVPQDHDKQLTESQGEELIYYTQQEEAPSQEHDSFLQAALLTGEFCNFPQTSSVESEESTVKSEVLHGSIQKTTVQAELSKTLLCSTVQPGPHTILNATLKSNKFSNSSWHSEDPFIASPCASIQSTINFSNTANIQSTEPIRPTPTETVQTMEPITSPSASTIQSTELLTSSNLAAIRYTEPFTSSNTLTVQCTDPLTSINTGTVQVKELITSSLAAIVQSNDPLTSTETATVQSIEPFTSSISLCRQSLECITSSPVTIVQLKDPFTFADTENVHSKKPNRLSQKQTVQTREPIRSSNIATVLSQEPSRPSHTTTVKTMEHIRCANNANVQSKEPIIASNAAIVQSTEPIRPSHSTTVQSKEHITCANTATVQSTEPIKPSDTATVQALEHIIPSHTASVKKTEPFASPCIITAQSKEPFASLHNATVKSKQSIRSSQNITVQSMEPFASSSTASVQSIEPIIPSNTASVQSIQPIIPSNTTSVQSIEPIIPSNTASVQSIEPIRPSNNASVQSIEPIRPSTTATIQSRHPLRSSQNATFQSMEPFTSSHTASEQSKEPPALLYTASARSEEAFKSLMTKTVPSEERCSSIKIPPSLSIEPFDCLLTDIIHSLGPCTSSLTVSDQPEEINRHKQMKTVQSEKNSDLFRNASLQSSDLYFHNEAQTVQLENQYNLQRSAPEDLYQTMKAVSTHPELLHQSMQVTAVQPKCHYSVTAAKDQAEGTFDHQQGLSIQLAEPYFLKQAPPVQSEEIYLSTTCESHWSDRVPSNKVAVEASPVRIIRLCEAEKNKSVDVGEPIALRCEISDPNAQVTWYKDGLKLHEASGQEVLAEGSVRTLTIQTATPAHAGNYSCKTTDDAVQFHVDVKAPSLTFSALSEADQRKEVKTGCPIALQCELSESMGQVSWYKDGTKLLPQNGVDLHSEGNLRSLVVPSAERTHSGIYRCESKDDDVQFDVEVKALPVKFSYLGESDRNKSVQEGSPFLLSCELSHDPSTHVDWYKDEKEFLPTDNMEVQSDGLTRTLHIHSAEHSHGGSYECSTSDDTIMFKVDVTGRSPQILPISLSEKYKMIAIGCPIILQCEVSDPVAQVSWFKDEEELYCKTGLDMKRDGTLRKLIIHSAKVSDSGLYSCGLTDDVVTFHVDVKATHVRFSALPEVTRNKFVEAGCPLMLQCDVSEPTAQVYWHKDGEQLLPNSEYDMQTADKRRALVVKSAEIRHTGIYSCEAADDQIEFKVDVAAVAEAEGSTSVEAGIPIKLQREISDFKNQTCWYEDGINLMPKSIMTMDSEVKERTLAVKSVSPSCSGEYSCKTDDDSDISHFCEEEVKASPVTFAHIPEEELFKSVVEQEQLVLSCEVSRSDGVVQWYKDGTETKPSSNILMQEEGTKRTLKIQSAQVSDSGMYTCRAGDSVIMFKVNIREPPVTIIYPKEDVHLERHVPEEIILSCELSRPNGLVSWYKDGQKLQESENIKLKVEGPYRRLKILCGGVEDSGEYVCDTAHDSIFFHLNITEPPVRIVSPSQSQMELCQQASERMVLSCEISRPNALVRWYRDGLEVEENDNLILEVDGVYRRLIIPETTVRDSAEYVCDTADDSMTFFVNIAEPPVRFIRPRKMASRVEKVAGETLVLDCEVSRSNAEVTWKKNGEEVEDSRNITILEDGVMRRLNIHSLNLEDAGQYVCDAKDDVMDFHIKVQELPVKILGKDNANTEKQFLLSDDIILVCELSRSNGSVSWYKDNKLIDDTERYCSEEQGVFRSLVVLSAGLEDSGEYTCDAVDDKMVFYISVKEPPVQIIGNSGQPEHHILVEGDDLILECEVSRPSATVQWLRNGKILKPDTRVQIDSYDVVRKLVLSGLQPLDSGKYVCDAVDDKVITIVEVQELPVMFVNKETNSNITAYENESVTLCAIVCRERANVRWLKDGQLLDEDNIHISSEGNTHKLTINPLQLSDSGEYVCDVNTDEMFFSLLVKEMMVKFIKPLESIVALKGSSLILRCEVTKPKGDVQWLKDGREISPSRRHTIRAPGRERSFTIHQLVEEDSGDYICESTDDRTSATVTVEIPRVVEFIAELHNITVCEGEDAVFKCVLSPEDTQLAWHLNGKLAALNERAVISSNGLCHILCIHNCMVSDSSTVTADAEGLVSEAELQVQEQQVLFIKKMTPVVAEEYSEATLQVEVNLDSGEVQWMRQGVLIHPGAKYTLKHKGQKHSLRIHRLAMSDRGTYSCETLHDRTQAQLTVDPRKVTINRGLTDVNTTERETASFEVELSHPHVTGTWMRNGIKLKPTSHFRMSAKCQVHSLTISNLAIEDTGNFMFCVENLKTSARLVVKEPLVTIIRKLEDKKFPDGTIISLECELSRHNVDVKWRKSGVEMKPNKDMRIYAMGRKRFLQIMRSHVSDSGIYTCDTGDATTSCSVEVYERELLILKVLEDLDIQEDQNAVFVCELSVEEVPGEWYKNGERIQPTSTIKIRQEGTKHFLLMCNVRAEDSGEIKFVGRHVESVAYLEVEALPISIVKTLQDKTALENSRVILDCTVSNPRCSIRWFKGNTVILPSEHFEICSEGGYRKLIIQQVALEDDGTYSVQVGDYTCSARLTVDAQSLLMVRELEDVEVMAPDEACFECEVSVPVLRAPVWSLNEETLQSSSYIRLEKMGTVHRLIFKQTSADMSGVVEFTCGKAKSRAHLWVLITLVTTTKVERNGNKTETVTKRRPTTQHPTKVNCHYQDTMCFSTTHTLLRPMEENQQHTELTQGTTPTTLRSADLWHYCISTRQRSTRRMKRKLSLCLITGDP